MNFKTLVDTPPWDWPDNAGRLISKTLANKNADLPRRIQAAELAGTLGVMNDSMADALLATISAAGEPEELRAAAAISLGPVLEEADTQGFEEDPDFVSISERMFDRIREKLHGIYLSGDTPKLLKRRILEASVRAPADWHTNEIASAYASGDRDWVLTAVFAMGCVRGFNEQILESLKNPDPEIQLEAIAAAGTWEIDAAWPHVLALVQAKETPKHLLLGAISSLGQIRPTEAEPILTKLTQSEDEDVAEAADEALATIEGESFDEDEDDEEFDSEWLN